MCLEFKNDPMLVLSRATSLTTQNLEFYYVETQHSPALQLEACAWRHSSVLCSIPRGCSWCRDPTISARHQRNRKTPWWNKVEGSVVKWNPSSGGVVACMSVCPLFQRSCLTPPLPTTNRKVQMPPSGERSWNMHIFNRLSIWIGWAALFLCTAPTGMPLS